MREASLPRIVVLTGAGISKESGLDTFRDAGGIWSRVRLEDVATPEAFVRDPARVHAFYNDRRRQLLSAEVAPNPAHAALARLERARPGEVLVVTQNIDDLHERAGSRAVVHMHGDILKARCEACGGVLAWCADLSQEHDCSLCGARGRLRVDVVWFGEMPKEMERIGEALANCDLFVAIGTSATVYPAAGFVEIAREEAGAECIELNLEPSAASRLFDRHRHGPASRIVPAFVEEILARETRR